jgi:hypothetical protein
VSDAIARALQGHSQRLRFDKDDVGNTSSTSSCWKTAKVPAAGAAGAAAPGGTAHVSTDTGALSFANPASGTLHLVGADAAVTASPSTLLLYDRLFSVAKTMSSTTTEAVTGVPTRYQSTVATDADYAGDNFLFVETFNSLSATAHNWTVCQYTNQAGTTTKEMPSLTGLSSCPTSKIDHPTHQWFVPLADGDTGIQALTQMQCSASVTGDINFVIGHPIGFMTFPIYSTMIQFDWLIASEQAPRIFDNACLAFISPVKGVNAALSFMGYIVLTAAAA